MKSLNTLLAITLTILALTSCARPVQSPTIRIAINPWPGYEFLYLAAQKGYFEAEGLDIELLELASLADVKRVFEQGRADGMASTAIEVVQVASTLDTQIHVVLIPDYSDGGDVIVAKDPISTPADLKGKKVGVEIGLLGSYILSRALNTNGISADDVIEINVEQLSAEQALLSGQIDAMVTYPPFSTAILKRTSIRQIFSTAEIPGEVIDTVSIRGGAITDLPAWRARFHNAWQRALDFAAESPDEAYRIMAEREGITAQDFADALTGMTILDKRAQSTILGSKKLTDNLQRVCETLIRTNEGSPDCSVVQRRVSV